MSWTLSTELSDAAQQRCERYLDAVQEASGDREVVLAVWTQLDESLQTAGATGIADVEAVLLELEPPEAFGELPPTPTDRAEATLARLSLAVLLVGIPLSVALGGAYGEEAGGAAWLCTLTGGLMMGAQSRRHRLGRAALTLAAVMLVLPILIESFGL